MTLNPHLHSDPIHAGGFGTSDEFWGQRALFLRNDHGLDQGGGTTALSFGRPSAIPEAPARKGFADRLRARYPDFELVPDLGSRIGTLQWYRGAATCIGLCAVTLFMAPGLENPIYGYVPPALEGSEWEAARAQSITPLGKGAGTGYRMAATALVQPLAETPERPVIDLTATLSSGNGLLSALRRSGVGATDASFAAELIGNAIDLDSLASGTTLDLRLGRRMDKSQPRPLERLAFRARFDLSVEVVRSGAGLALKQVPIAVDHTPLRIRGKVGPSLYRSARALGAPAKAVEAFIRSIASEMPVSRLGADAEFDMIVEQARAETGEVQMGDLLYAGVTQGSRKVQLVRWEDGGRTEWLDTRGRRETRGTFDRPANGRLSSGYGMRRHPLLGYRRMHKGLDIAAPTGTPIRAPADGTVTFAGRNGGYGNFMRVRHSNGLSTGYGHVSRFAVRSGARVRQGQVIAYVGSTGVSTGPHLHWEVYRNGQAINPNSVSFSNIRQLSGGELSEFRSKLNRLMAVPVSVPVREEADAAGED